MKIAFIWQGFSGRYGQWKDGLYAAMKLIEKEHKVGYFDFTRHGITEILPTDYLPVNLQTIESFNPDVVLYWEAPVTNKGKDADNWFAVCALPYPKALLFAGGPLKAIDVKDFDLVFVESQINEEDCEREGIPYKRAFGVNTRIMKPLNLEKKWDGILAATYASWKRHELFAEALQSKGLAVGRVQEHDLNGYNRCKQLKVNIMDEVAPAELANLYNQSHVAVNTAEYWGGGQRMTLEALACGVPVIVMADSPKNIEFIRETPCGTIVDPTAEAIREAVTHWKEMDVKDRKFLSLTGITYIKHKWTERHYADSLLTGILSII